MNRNTTNGIVLPLHVHMARLLVCVCLMVASPSLIGAQITIHSDPYVKTEEGPTQTVYFLSYYGTDYTSCTKSTKQELLGCFDTVAKTLSGNPSGSCTSTYKGWNINGKAYTFEGGNHTVGTSKVTFRSVGYYEYGGCYYYAATGASRSYDIKSMEESGSTNQCIPGRASGDSQIPPPVGTYGCIDAGVMGCSMFIDNLTTNHYASGDTYSWSARVTGGECDPNEVDQFTITPVQIANNQNDENAINDANPFVCTDTPDGLLSCVNNNHIDEDQGAAFAEHATDQAGENLTVDAIEPEGCTSIKDGQYFLCPNDSEPDTHNDGIAENDHTLISTTIHADESQTNTIINQYMHEGSAADHGQPDNSTDTGQDTDGDGDSDGDVDGDGDSDNGDLVAKLEALNNTNRATNRKLDDVNDNLTGISGQIGELNDTIGDLNNAGSFTVPTDGEEIGDSLTGFWGELQQVPIVAAIDNLAPTEQQGSCPSLNFDLPFGWTSISTTMHCDIWETIKPILETAFTVAWSVAAFVILFSA